MRSFCCELRVASCETVFPLLVTRYSLLATLFYIILHTFAIGAFHFDFPAKTRRPDGSRLLLSGLCTDDEKQSNTIFLLDGYRSGLRGKQGLDEFLIGEWGMGNGE